MRSFAEMKLSRNGEINLLFTDVGQSRTSYECLTSQKCILTLFAKIKFSRKFLNVEYLTHMPEAILFNARIFSYLAAEIVNSLV